MEEDKPVLDEKKLRRLRNLKYFKEWTDEQIIAWHQLRHGNEAPPPEPPDLSAEIPQLESNPDTPSTVGVSTTFDPVEYKKKYNMMLQRYKKEYAVDMNDANDAESLRALVSYVIQQEKANELIMAEQSTKIPDHRVLKGLGDFQRSIQMNINELQEKLGITRKARKERQHDDIPQYIKAIQEKAKDFWERKTVGVTCKVCDIELARYWLNFPDKTDRVQFDLICEKCEEKVTYSETHFGRG